ncbi:hypothetical protein C8J56DRAFT_982452 [Mycena floridula]|nr:hypothetical protein C8J56DRAFT_982452 [Mycena floridula]
MVNDGACNRNSRSFQKVAIFCNLGPCFFFHRATFCLSPASTYLSAYSFGHCHLRQALQFLLSAFACFRLAFVRRA